LRIIYFEEAPFREHIGIVQSIINTNREAEMVVFHLPKEPVSPSSSSSSYVSLESEKTPEKIYIQKERSSVDNRNIGTGMMSYIRKPPSPVKRPRTPTPDPSPVATPREDTPPKPAPPPRREFLKWILIIQRWWRERMYRILTSKFDYKILIFKT